MIVSNPGVGGLQESSDAKTWAIPCLDSLFERRYSSYIGVRGYLGYQFLSWGCRWPRAEWSASESVLWGRGRGLASFSNHLVGGQNGSMTLPVCWGRRLTSEFVLGHQNPRNPPRLTSEGFSESRNPGILGCQGSNLRYLQCQVISVIEKSMITLPANRFPQLYKETP